MTSIPVNVNAFAATQELLYEIPGKMWALFAALMVLLGSATFYGALMWRSRNNNPPAPAAAGAPVAKQQQTQPGIVEVRAGKVVVCDPCGDIIDDRSYAIRVPAADAGKYKIEYVHTSACQVCEPRAQARPQPPQDDGAYYGYYNDRKPDGPRPGMAKNLVRSLWGEPMKVEFVRRGGSVAERWYFGDPLFGISSNNRYVEYDESGMVAYVKDARPSW